jgi:hypothetical protein
MYFKQFSQKLSEDLLGDVIIAQSYAYGHLIEKTIDGVILVDHIKSEFNSLEEARNFIKQEYYINTLEEEIAKEIYEEISDTKIADIIKEHHNVKVTDTLIESYKELASSKQFTLDPVAQMIRNLNSFDKIIENKIDYILNDGTIVAINKDTQTIINNLLRDEKAIVDYMKESKDNFLSVIEQIKE